MRKNILIVSAAYFPDLGGAGIVAKNISEQLYQDGYNVTVFCGGKINKTETIGGVKIYRKNTLKNISPYVIENYYNQNLEAEFLDIIKNHQIEAVHFHSIQGLGANLINLSLKLDLKTVLTMHDFWWECPLLFLNDEYSSSQPIKKHLKYCNHISTPQFLNKRKNYLYKILKNKKITITIVSKTMKKAVEYIKLPNAASYICIPNGILQKNNLSTTPKDRKTNSKIEFAYFGGDNYSKGFYTLLKAAKTLKFNTNNYNINLFGIHRPIIKTLLNFKFMSKYHIKLNGPFDNGNLKNILSRIDVVVIPSQVFESFSLIARESLINNTPIISSGMGGLSEITDNRHIKYNKTSSLDLAKKMFYVIKNIDKINKHKTNFKYISLEKQSKLFQKIYNA